MLTLDDIMRELRSVAELFYPHLCPVCGGRIEGDHQKVCTRCMVDAPLTGFEQLADNPVSRRVWNLIPAQRACALLYYVHEGKWRNLAHRFKFAGRWRYAVDAGRMMGSMLAESPLWGDVDCVAAVPLHTLRKLSRGYNQSEYIAKGVAEALGVEHLTGCLSRHTYNRPQVDTDKDKRWDNVEGIFSVTHPERLSGRHILLIDDVFTTGATTISCGEAILRAVPDCRLSIATLFVSKQELGISD